MRARSRPTRSARCGATAAQSPAVVRESRVCGGSEGRRCRCCRARSRHDEDASSVFRRPRSTRHAAPLRRRLVAARNAGGVARTSRFLAPSPMRSSPRGHGIGEGGREGSTLQQEVRACVCVRRATGETGRIRPASPRLAAPRFTYVSRRLVHRLRRRVVPAVFPPLLPLPPPPSAVARRDKIVLSFSPGDASLIAPNSPGGTAMTRGTCRAQNLPERLTADRWSIKALERVPITSEVAYICTFGD